MTINAVQRDATRVCCFIADRDLPRPVGLGEMVPAQAEKFENAQSDDNLSCLVVRCRARAAQTGCLGRFRAILAVLTTTRCRPPCCALTTTGCRLSSSAALRNGRPATASAAGLPPSQEPAASVIAEQ